MLQRHTGAVWSIFASSKQQEEDGVDEFPVLKLKQGVKDVNAPGQLGCAHTTAQNIGTNIITKVVAILPGPIYAAKIS